MSSTYYWFSQNGIDWQRIDRGAFKSLAGLATSKRSNFPGERRYTIDRIGLQGELLIVRLARVAA